MCARRCTFVDANELYRLIASETAKSYSSRRFLDGPDERAPRAPPVPARRFGDRRRGCASARSPGLSSRARARPRGRTPRPRARPRASSSSPPPRALPPSDAVAVASAAALGAVAGAGLVALAWPIARRELRPIRCATCRGMSWTICDRCRGRGKTGCPPLVAAVDEYAAAAPPTPTNPPTPRTPRRARKTPSPAPRVQTRLSSPRGIRRRRSAGRRSRTAGGAAGGGGCGACRARGRAWRTIGSTARR